MAHGTLTLVSKPFIIIIITFFKIMIFLLLVDFFPSSFDFHNIFFNELNKEKINHLSFAILITIGVVPKSQFHNISESRKSMSSSVVKLKPEYLYQCASEV